MVGFRDLRNGMDEGAGRGLVKRADGLGAPLRHMSRYVTDTRACRQLSLSLQSGVAKEDAWVGWGMRQIRCRNGDAPRCSAARQCHKA